MGVRWTPMRVVTTIAFGFAAALVLVALAAAWIGQPSPRGAPHGGLTAATVLRSDGSRADAPAPPGPADTARPSS